MVFLLLFLVLLLRKLPGAGMCGRDRDDVGRFDMPKEERVVVQFLLLEVVWFLFDLVRVVCFWRLLVVVEFSLAGCWAVAGTMAGCAAVGGWWLRDKNFWLVRGGEVECKWLKEVIHGVEG